MSKPLDRDGAHCFPAPVKAKAKKWRPPPRQSMDNPLHAESSDQDGLDCGPAAITTKKWKPPRGNNKDKPNFDLPPAPNPTIECFRNDPWVEHPLLRYDSVAEKKHLDNEVVIRRGKKVKNAVADVVYRNMKWECGEPVKDDNGDLEAFLTQADFDEYRRDSVKSAPVVPIQKSWLRHIAALIPKDLKKRNLPLFRALIKEVEERYEMVLHESILNFVLVPPEGYVDPYLLVIKYPLFSNAPPPWWETFRINRHIIEQQLRLLYPIVAQTFLKMRGFMNTYKLFDPEKIAEKLGSANYLRPEELKDLIIQQIKENGELFLQKFIPHLVRIFQNPNALKNVSAAKQELIMDCASHMIVADATAWAMDTIREISQTYENYTQFLPRILVDTAIEDGKITFGPPVEGWLYCFKKIVDEIIAVIQNIPDVAELFWGRFEEDKSIKVFCRVSIPNFIVDTLTDRFRSVMQEWLSEVQAISDRIYDMYKPLLDGTVKAVLQSYIDAEEKTFYDGFKNAAALKQWTNSVYDIPKTEFIGWLQVNNEDVIGRLLDICKTHNNMISEYLAKWIRAHNYAIIMGYKDIRDRLLTKPKTTAELMELVEYIDEARGVLLLLLKEDVIESLKMCLAYMDYYLLSADDMELAITAQKMLHKIQPAFEKSAIMIEEQKALFEEQLHQKVADMKEDLAKLLRRVREDFGRYGDYNEVSNYCDDLRYVNRRVELLQEGVDWINAEEALFKFTPTEFTDIQDIKDHLIPYTRLFETTLKWQKAERKYMKGDFDLDAEEIDKETEGYFNELTELQALFKSRIKAEKELEAKEKHIPVSLLYDEDNLTEIPPPLKICMEALESLAKFRTNLPAMMILCNPALRQRHWEQMSEFSDKELVPDTGSSLKKLLEKGLDAHMEEFEEISFTATQELALANTIGEMKEIWKHEKIESVPYKDTEVNVLQDADEIQYLLKQHILETQVLKGSRFAAPHKETVADWLTTLQRAAATMDEWQKVQKRWTYLEHMFSSEEMAALLPEESALFSQVDDTWRNIMADLEQQTTALDMAKKAGLCEKLEQCSALLEKVVEGLNKHLEETRVSFPRLFFLTNEEAVLILAETKDANKVQPYLNKLFEGINELRIDSEMLAFGILSSEGERVTFSNPVDTCGVKGSVEKWLAQVEDAMVSSLKSLTTNAKDAYLHTLRSEWVLKWPGQVIISVSQIYWTYEVHKAFTRSTAGIQAFLAKSITHLDNTIDLVRSDIPKLSRVILGALVTTDVHARDILQELIAKRVQSDTDFLWISQLRYYFEDFQVVLRILNSHVNYGYEYVGSPTRLVVTPLTDRCYRILIGAYHLNLYGALVGPASSGKTEIAKDLAKTIAKQCVVLNCSADLNHLVLGRFVKGMASAGAWVVFDDFNRLDPAVMSVIGQQLWTVQQAVASKMGNCVLDGKELALNLECNAIITMNPGYAERHELPENLKVLCRPVSVMMPDFKAIGEIYLYSIGFVHSKDLSAKLSALCLLCFEQLSSEPHYDFGMRAVKAILIATGAAKLKYPEIEEHGLFLKSIHDVFLPQLNVQDIPFFEGIVSDLFHGVKPFKPDPGPLVIALKAVCENRGLQPTDYFIEKALQIYKCMSARHGLIIVGEPMGGKTCAYQCLAAALTDMKNNKTPGIIDKRVQYKIINPKSITMGQLYGAFDPVTQEWKDGIVASTFREMANSTNDDRKWMVFDGPVDALWIENMNTVLDDNRKLCLMSGEIIKMTPLMTTLFELSDLDHASPATISRCGMIYLEPQQLGWRPLKDSYLSKVEEEGREILEELFEWLIPPCLTFIQQNCESFIPTSELHMFQSFIRLYRSFVGKLGGDGDAGESSEINPIWLQCSFIFCLVWCLGATLIQDSRKQFEAFYRALLTGNNKDYPRPKSVKLTKNQMFPDKGSVFDYICDRSKENNPWSLWMDIVNKEDLKIPLNANANDLIIPTDETSRQMFFLKTYLNSDIPLLLVGPTGTGKSVITLKYLMSLPKEKFISTVINFSAKTSASQAQEIIMSKLTRRKKGIYGPVAGKKCIVFVDDFSMPQKETYGAQPPIELIRQWIDHGNWYDKESATISLIDMVFVGAMGSGGGRINIPARLVRHMNVLAIDSFEDYTLKKIFTSIVDWHFAKEYESTIVSWAKPMISATMQVYKAVTSLFLPTPAKSHYYFNLRDFSRVIRGLMLIPPTHLPEPTKLMRLWVHEVYRVFYDRLVDDKDRTAFFQLVEKTVQDCFKQELQKLLGHLSGQKLEHVNIRRLMFGAYMDPKSEDKIYNEVTDMNKLSEVMEGYLNEYNSSATAPMSLVLFQYAIEHISRIARILKQDNGHALLAGIVGVGRQSLARMAAFMSGHDLIQIELTRTYGTQEWREDLKRVLKSAGFEGKHTVFLFADTQIKDEGFVEDINMILNTGDVPNLFVGEERGEILEKMQSLAKERGKKMETSPLALYNMFVAKVRANLHVVLAMSPVGDAFRVRLRTFPSLINCCTIDWFTEWPGEALERVAQKFLSNLKTTDKIRASCVMMCQNFHESLRKLSAEFYEIMGRRNYVTPTSYLELILTFKYLLRKRTEELQEQRQRYIDGLDKLAFAAAQIAVMRDELAALQPKLRETSAATEKLMIKIKADTVEVEAAKKVIAADEVLANEAAAKAQVMKEECEKDLSVALPALEAALQALDTIKTADIAVVKSMKNPPNGVKMVLEAVCIMRGIKPEKKMDANGRPFEDYWASSLRMLGNMKFLDALKEYDKDNIPEPVIKKIRERFIHNPDFDHVKMKNISRACEGLVKWIQALEVYDRVNRVVQPKKLKLAEAENELQRQLDKLNEKRRQLQEVTDKLQALNDEYEAMIKKKKELEDKILHCQQKLELAEKLIAGFGGERARWSDEAAKLADQLRNIIGNVLVGSGIVAYLGAFTVEFRQGCVKKWHKLCLSQKIPCSSVFSLSGTLGDPLTISNWHLAGLPIDAFSIDNGIIATNARRWPLMIDPQGMGSKWIRNLEKSRKLGHINLSDPGYMRVLEQAIQTGVPVLLDNVGEDIDPALEPVLLKQTFKQDDIVCIKIGDNIIEFNENFRFYIITRLRNPHYLPETAVKVTLLNFMITPFGLQDQLLGIVVTKEEPMLEEKKNKLVLDSVNNRNLLNETEDKILEVLANSEGNILEDDDAIQILTSAKEISQDILNRQKISAVLEKKIDEIRNRYRPVALHASTLFFCISELANIDPMYQYSLEWFINLFISSISNSRQTKDLATRIHLLNEHFTSSIYRNVCRSLFDQDKLVFSFVLCVALNKSNGAFDMETWKFFLTGGTALDNTPPNPAPQWLSDRSWSEVVRVSNLAPFTKLMNHVRKNLKMWKVLHDSPEPQNVKLQTPWDKLSDLERLVILRVFRRDKLVPAVQMYITKNLGKEFIEPPSFDLESSFQDSNSATPLVFLLSPGADPTLGLFKFAADKGYSGKKMHCISLGQGQGPVARRLIDEALSEGSWVVLQNCHLATSWMPVLEMICQDVITSEGTNPAFRLWLTSYPSPYFPITVLQNSVKMTNEAPPGLRANLLRNYTGNPIADPNFYNSVKQNPSAWNRMMFGLCFFHAVVQERRRFGPLGWNNFYEFSESDLRISMVQLQMLLSENMAIPFDLLTYLTGECNYGGRVTDDKDRRLLNSLLSTYYNSNIVDVDNYSLSPSGLYHVPQDTTYNEALGYIRQLPMNANPEVYGLHENSSITKGNHEAMQLLDGSLLTQPELKSVSVDADTSGSKVVAIAQDILSKLPADFDLDAVLQKFPVEYANSINSVLRQELIRFNKLTTIVREGLLNVQGAVKGSIAMSSELDELFKSMLIGMVPKEWAAKSYPSLKPLGSYITDLLQRLSFLQKWIDNGPPTVYWLAGFYFPQSFLTGLTQNYARKHKIPIDHLGFEFEITSHEKNADAHPKDGAFCRGLFLEGARWDRQKRQLAESYPKILHDSIPVTWFRPGEKAKFVPKPSYDCPVYITSGRGGTLSTTGHSTNFVLYLKLLTNLAQQHWINRGTAALCQLDD